VSDSIDIYLGDSSSNFKRAVSSFLAGVTLLLDEDDDELTLMVEGIITRLKSFLFILLFFFLLTLCFSLSCKLLLLFSDETYFVGLPRSSKEIHSLINSLQAIEPKMKIEVSYEKPFFQDPEKVVGSVDVPVKICPFCGDGKNIYIKNNIVRWDSGCSGVYVDREITEGIYWMFVLICFVAFIVVCTFTREIYSAKTVDSLNYPCLFFCE
jgi:hypothetical protein